MPRASATVRISATPLADILAGRTTAVISPQEVQDTALALAGDNAIFQLAAQSTANRYGSAGDLNGATSVTEVAARIC